MTARSRTIWVAAALAILFAALVAWALFTVERPENVARAGQERATRVLSFSPAEVTSISISPTGRRETRLVRTADGWREISPADGPAAALPVEGFLDRLSSMRVRGAPLADAGPRGLAPPVSRVVLSLRDGRTLALELGDEIPFDRTRYGRINEEIRVIEGVPPAAVDPAPDAFRSAPDAR
jgi:hypothetical protein